VLVRQAPETPSVFRHAVPRTELPYDFAVCGLRLRARIKRSEIGGRIRTFVVRASDLPSGIRAHPQPTTNSAEFAVSSLTVTSFGRFGEECDTALVQSRRRGRASPVSAPDDLQELCHCVSDGSAQLIAGLMDFGAILFPDRGDPRLLRLGQVEVFEVHNRTCHPIANRPQASPPRRCATPVRAPGQCPDKYHRLIEMIAAIG
jgi:hypothetical protein